MTSQLLRARDNTIPTATSRFRGLLQIDRTFGLIDLCLAVAAITMVFTDQFMLVLQITFLLLLLGACYWNFSGFVGRTLLWGGLATAELVVAVVTDQAPRSHLYQWFVMLPMIVIVHALVSRRNIVERSLNHAEQHDHLTKLPNRTAFLRHLDEALASPTPAFRALAVVIVNVDNFAEVNRALGHRAADELLVVIGERLRACIRGTDTVGRGSGDEYLIAVAVDPAATTRIAERIMSAIAMPYFINGEAIRITASLGIALTEDPSPDMRDQLLRDADTAMRRVKAEGKAGYEIYSQLLQAA